MTDTTAAADAAGADREGPDAAGAAGTAPFGLRWAIKPSFIAYVSRMPDGRAYLGKGVTVNARDEILFELDQQATDHAFAFLGEVLFSAHFGMMSVLISRPGIVLHGAEGELTVADPESGDGGRLRLVTFTIAGPAV